MIREKDKPMLSKIMFGGSLVAAVLAGIGALGTDIYLASTQWILVAILLAAWGIFLLLEAKSRKR